MQVSAREWNDFVDRIFRSRLLSVFLNWGAKWRHPWFTRINWEPTLGTYTARVKPGFCLSDGTVAVTARNSDGEDVRLSDDPDLPIKPETWRAIGTDALSINGGFEPIPDYFKARGVIDPVNIDANTVEGVTQEISGFVTSRDNARLLRACDLVLYHDRLQTSTEWTEGNGESGSFAQMNVTLTSPPNLRKEAYLRIVTEYEPPAEADFITKLLGGWAGNSFDSHRIATLYLLSPAGWKRGTPDSEAWQGYVKHHTYWNLRYWQKIVEPPPAPENLQLAGQSLGGGALGAAGNPLLALVNDNNAELTALLSRAEASGKFFSI